MGEFKFDQSLLPREFRLTDQERKQKGIGLMVPVKITPGNLQPEDVISNIVVVMAPYPRAFVASDLRAFMEQTFNFEGYNVSRLIDGIRQGFFVGRARVDIPAVMQVNQTLRFNVGDPDRAKRLGCLGASCDEITQIQKERVDFRVYHDPDLAEQMALLELAKAAGQIRLEDVRDSAVLGDLDCIIPGKFLSWNGWAVEEVRKEREKLMIKGANGRLPEVKCYVP